MQELRSWNITFEVWGAAFCLIGIACTLLLSRANRHYTRLIVAMFTCAFFAAAGDAMAGTFRGQEYSIAWFGTHFGNLVSICADFCLLAVFTTYLCCRLRESGNRDYALWFRIVQVGALVFSVFAVFGLFFYIDKNNIYHRSNFFFLAPAFAVVVDIVNAVLVMRERKSLTPLARDSLLFYVLSPIVLSAAQIFIYGLNLIVISSVLGLVIVFAEMQAYSSQVIQERTEELARAKEEAAEARISAMVSQIQPHFLFNTLDSIYYLASVDPPKACRAIDMFSSYLRANLSSLDCTGPIPIAEEMSHVSTYLELEKMSKDELLEYDICENVSNFEVPALSVQTLVENAVRHGIGKKKNGGYVKVTTDKSNNCFMVIITDDGLGFDPSAKLDEGRHVGIMNTRARVEAMCGGSLELKSAPAEGTTAILRIPKKCNNDI